MATSTYTPPPSPDHIWKNGQWVLPGANDAPIPADLQAQINQQFQAAMQAPAPAAPVYTPPAPVAPGPVIPDISAPLIVPPSLTTPFGFGAGETSGIPDGSDIFSTDDDAVAEEIRKQAAQDALDVDGDPLTPNWIVGSDQPLVDYGDGTYGPQYDWEGATDTNLSDSSGGGLSPALISQGEAAIEVAVETLQADLAGLDPSSPHYEADRAEIEGQLQSIADATHTGSDRKGAHGTDSRNPVSGGSAFPGPVYDDTVNQSMNAGSVIQQQVENGLNIWAQLILTGDKSIDDVPEGLRGKVQGRVDNPPPAVQRAVDDHLNQVGPPADVTDPVIPISGDDPIVDGPLPDTSTDDNGHPVSPDLDADLPDIIDASTGEVIDGKIPGEVDLIKLDIDGLTYDIDNNPVFHATGQDGTEAEAGKDGGTTTGAQTDVDPNTGPGDAKDQGSVDTGGGQTPPIDEDDDDTGIDIPDINIPPIGGGDDNDTNDGDDDVGDLLDGVIEGSKQLASSVSSVLQTDVGNSTIGDILGGGINFYGQQEAAEAYERQADKALEWQKELQGKQEPFWQAGVDALPGLADANNTDLSPDPRENLRTLNTESSSRAGLTDPDAFGGYDSLRNFEGQTGNWREGLLTQDSAEAMDMRERLMRDAQNRQKATGRHNTQETYDRTALADLRATGAIDEINRGRIGDMMATRGYDRDTASGQRAQEAGEQSSASQLRFNQLSQNRERAFNELFTDDQATFDRRTTANQQQLAERDQYWRELLQGDESEWAKLFNTARLGQSAASGQAAGATNAADILGAKGASQSASTAGGYEAIAGLFSGNPYENAKVVT